MSKNLIEKMRKAREFVVEVDGYKFTCLRPEDADVKEMLRDFMDNYAMASRFVVGWEGVKESDLFPSGGSDAVAFDANLWITWLRGEMRFWKPIGEQLREAYKRRQEQKEASGKA